MNEAVSQYMREMQRRSAKIRWSGMSAAEKSAAMKALRAKGVKKSKRVARRSKRQGFSITVCHRAASACQYIARPVSRSTRRQALPTGWRA